MLADATVAGASPIVSGSAPRVLVVDDEDAVLLTIQGVLELDGYDAVATSSGLRALELIRLQPFDMLLTDLRLSDLDGAARVAQGIARRRVDHVDRLRLA
jgi:CheY-like chemotaxis protein